MVAATTVIRLSNQSSSILICICSFFDNDDLMMKVCLLQKLFCGLICYDSGMKTNHIIIPVVAISISQNTEHCGQQHRKQTVSLRFMIYGREHTTQTTFEPKYFKKSDSDHGVNLR